MFNNSIGILFHVLTTHYSQLGIAFLGLLNQLFYNGSEEICYFPHPQVHVDLRVRVRVRLSTIQ